MKAEYANHIWGIDIPYVRLTGGWMYLAGILERFSRFVIVWELDQTLELPLVWRVVDRALEQATPMIWNSDPGHHFTSPQYLDRLSAAGVRICMDGWPWSRSGQHFHQTLMAIRQE